MVVVKSFINAVSVLEVMECPEVELGFDDMQCIRPIRIKSGLMVPCGHCVACRIARTREWAVRLYHEKSSWKETSFVTLTYDDDHLPVNNSLSKRELQLFFKRLRKQIVTNKIKYYACGEYGENTDRPHYHAIIYGFDGCSVKGSDLLKDEWPLGFVKCGSVTFDSCRYVCQYVQKKYDGLLAEKTYGCREPPFQLQSLGLGKDFALKHADQIRNNLDITIDGKHVGIPKYYVKKLGLELEMRTKAVESNLDDVQIKLKHMTRIDPRTDSLELKRLDIKSREQRERNINGKLDTYRDSKL